MPKEYINNRYYGQFAEKASRDADGNGCAERVAIDDSAVKVGWSRDGCHVEVAVVHHRDGTDSDSGHWHAQMDREGLNRLIRSLRKARDAAFGADA